MKKLWNNQFLKKIDEKEALEFKKISNLYLDKRIEIMINTQFNVEETFGETLNKFSISPEQNTRLNNFLGKTFWVSEKR